MLLASFSLSGWTGSILKTDLCEPRDREGVSPNMNPTETPNDDMDFRTFFGKCPTAAKTETKPETKTYPMSLTTEKIVEHMCKTKKWVLRNGPRHNWFVIKGKTLYIDEKEGCRIVCADKAFEAQVSQAFKTAWDDLTPPEERETKTETKTETEPFKPFWNGVCVSHDPDTETKTEDDLEFEEAYRQGFKDGREEENSELLLNGWDFEPTLRDLANGCPPMSKWIGDECFYRYMTKEERESIYFHGQVIKFPVRWGLDGTTYERRGIPQKEWEAGERWTLGRVWRTARAVYSKNKQKAVKEMGDHHFWEGICEKTGEIYTGS